MQEPADPAAALAAGIVPVHGIERHARIEHVLHQPPVGCIYRMQIHLGHEAVLLVDWLHVMQNRVRVRRAVGLQRHADDLNELAAMRILAVGLAG